MRRNWTCSHFADENSAHLVELYLDVDITKFTEENKVQDTEDWEKPIKTCDYTWTCESFYRKYASMGPAQK